MNCFIFRRDSAIFPEICGVEPLHDLALHLRNSGMENIYSDSDGISPIVKQMKFADAESLLERPWLAAYEGAITRQSPLELMGKADSRGFSRCLSLACSGKPWKHATVLTGAEGEIQSIEAHPSPENAATNLCFSGLVLVDDTGFDPDFPASREGCAAFLLEGYWSLPMDREEYLRTAHEILSGRVSGWPMKDPRQEPRLPGSCAVTGTLWLGEDTAVGENCSFENCVIMDGASIGSGSRLRNCLVSPGASVKPGTVIDDKYLTLLGEE